MGKISIQDIARNISEKHGLSQQEAETFVSTLFNVIDEWLHTEKIVKVKGLGTFKVIDVRERESVNVNTGERVIIEGHSKITFTPDPIMRDLVNKPFAQFDTVILNEGVDLDEMSRIEDSGSDADNIDGNTDIPLEAGDEYPLCSETSGDSAATGQDEEKAEAVTDTVNDDVAEEDTFRSNTQEQKTATITEDNVVTDIEPVENDSVVATDVVSDDVENGKISDENQVIESKVTTVSSDNDIPTESVSEDNVADEELKSSLKRLKIVFSLSALFICLVAFVAGYYWGRNTVKPVVKFKVVHVMDEVADVPSQLKDSLPKSKTSVPVTKESQEPEKSEPDKEIKSVDEKAEKLSAEIPEDLNRAQAMVNTGAYCIIGTLKTVKVKKGETLKSISKFYLGEGMECYVQVHNGVSEVKEGMSLKIPKLKLKRRK